MTDLMGDAARVPGGIIESLVLSQTQLIDLYVIGLSVGPMIEKIRDPVSYERKL